MAKIDFEPSLFGAVDDTVPAAELPAPAASNAWRWIVVFVLGLMTVGAFAVSKHVASSTPADSTYSNSPLRGDIPSIPSLREPSPVAWGKTPDVASSGRREDCDGDEIICTIATVTKPAEMLRKLVAAIPKDGSKKYKVRLSVTPIEEPAKEEPASNSPDTP
ncbi:MAG: hypothetical protein M3Y55_05680 [Pseudomonadota bacterium]|nr:hypothetical protein [Pseudomonadota bacterium]